MSNELPKVAVRRYHPKRRCKGGNLRWIINLLVHLSITGATAFTLYKLYQQTTAAPPAPRVVVQRKELPQAKRMPATQPQPVSVEPAVIERPPAPIAEPVEVDIPPPPRQPPIIPPFASLPPPEHDQIATLAKNLADATIALRSLDRSLQLDDERVLFDREAVAGLRLHDGRVEFRWLPTASEDAVAAIVNAVVEVKYGGESLGIALREPKRIEAPTLDLEDATVRLVCKCDCPPPPELVRWSFTGERLLPTHKPDGADPLAMKAGDETLLIYSESIATRLRLKRSGNVAIAEFQTEYELPSGDHGLVEIARGNRKLRQLQGLADEAAAAQRALPQLQSTYRTLESDLRRAANLNTTMSTPAGRVQNPIAVAQKNAAISALRGQLAECNRRIAKANQLVRDKPAIEKDLQAINAVADVAQKLKGAPLAYRFYIEVAGHEVTLIEAAADYSPSSEDSGSASSPAGSSDAK